MSSSTIVPVALVSSIKPHPDPETTNLELVEILGWQLVSQRGKFQVGQRVVFVPPNNVLPDTLVTRLDIAKYVAAGNRVHSIRLRGEPSFGLAFSPDHDWEPGTNVADYYGIEKYIPPVLMTSEDSELEHPEFVRYSDIENLRNFPDIFHLGEPVIITEKIDGTNCRIGLIDGEVICGSFRVQHKRPEQETKKRSLYWYPYLHRPEVTALLHALGKQYRVVVLFGEVFGPGVRHFTYGLPKGRVDFRLFDIFCAGRYLDYDDAMDWATDYQVMAAPLLARRPYELEAIHRLANGQTLLSSGTNMREGVVVRPLAERTDPRVGRVIMKFIGDEIMIRQASGKIKDYTDA